MEFFFIIDPIPFHFKKYQFFHYTYRKLLLNDYDPFALLKIKLVDLEQF